MIDAPDWTIYQRIPFHEKGRSFYGCDCWGLVKLIYKQECAIILPGYDEMYENTRDAEPLARIINEEKNITWREVKKPEMFDVVLLRMRGLAAHVGLITAPKFMIHCMDGAGTTHEKYDSLRWGNKVLGFYRYEKKA